MPFSSHLIIIGSLLSQVLLVPVLAADKPLLFEVDVRPILTRKCGKCHSDTVRKGELDLSTMAGIRRGGESGESLVTKSLDESLLWEMVNSGDMPPEGQPPLTTQEITQLRRWLKEGAQSKSPPEESVRPLNQHDVLPIVLLRCTACHGPQRQDGGLDLRTRAAMLKGGQSGPALVPGKPDESLMIQRIKSEACPPQELLLTFFVQRPPVTEVEQLRKWIAAGAPVVDVQPDVASREPDRLVTDEERQHWAFQPPRDPGPGASIDGLIRGHLLDHDLDFSPEASRDVLIRRAYLDLLGLPPTVSQWKKWRGSTEPGWYAAMVDQLLESPHYGERWGRYWLDLAGYADSEGGVSADPLRAVAWKYRDYVIQSFNADKPYDRFLLEQVAGDELVDYEKADPVTDEMVDNLVATGFLRMGIDQTGSRTMNFVPERLGVIGDAIQVVGTGLMGLTMECARCHSHKYDPIPQRDYYRFKAIFQGALDEHDWLTFKNRVLRVATPAHRRRVAAINPRLNSEAKSLESRIKKAVAKSQEEVLKHHYPDQPEADRKASLVAIRTADNQRTSRQQLLAEQLMRVILLPDSEQPGSVLAARQALALLQNDLLKVQQQMEPPLEIRALWDRGEPAPTYILRRGEHTRPGQLVGPGVPSVLTDGKTPFQVRSPFPGGTDKTGRRLALARWLTRPDHPLTARVAVNRLWYHHFGTGLVKSLENFGVAGERPSHPELLDWLSLELVRRGWSIKEMHRLIMNSRTYRQSSRVTTERLQRDPQNRLLSRMSMQRMDAESLRDSLLWVAGKLEDRPGGIPDGVSIDRAGLVSAIATATGGWRRSIYLQYRRTEIPTMLATFDYPEMGPNCIERTVSIVSPQSLMLMNNRRVRELAASFARRVEKTVAKKDGANQGDQAWDFHVDTVYQLALSRSPSARERQLGNETLQKLVSDWEGDRHSALETYCHTILNSAAFIYID
ncbi:MAG: PSD1 and planctomycete cytochrome C domain-containing protein [Pirellulaceae bacterium]|nr:PSD1 and planctomycete cytochrome C domain-containing protein [Pirellulaceae bacterium]